MFRNLTATAGIDNTESCVYMGQTSKQKLAIATTSVVLSLNLKCSNLQQVFKHATKVECINLHNSYECIN